MTLFQAEKFSRRFWGRFLGVTLTLFLLPFPAWSQAYRDSLPIPSLNLNRQLLLYAQAGDPEKIEKILVVARSLTENIKAKYGVDIEGEVREALESGNPELLITRCRRLVYLDTLDLMDSTMDSLREASPKAKSQWKAAFLNYLLLSPYLKSVNPPVDQSIRDGFRGAGKLIPEEPGAEFEPESFRKFVGLIGEELKTALAVTD